MLILLILVSVWINVNLSDYSLTTQCINVYGDQVSFNGYFSEAECPVGYTVVSCGTRGGYIQNSSESLGSTGARIFGRSDEISCKSFKGVEGGIPVEAVARCCKLHSAVTCSTYNTISSSIHSSFTSSLCMFEDQVLFGCDAAGYYASNPSVDTVGARFTSLNYGWCEARNNADVPDTRGVRAYARCCRSTDPSTVKLQCTVKNGDTTKKTLTSSDPILVANVECDAGWFMTSCGTGYADVKNWYVANGAVCEVVKQAVDGKDYSLSAEAVCCQEVIIETEAPSSSPTESSPMAENICIFPKCESDVALDIGFLMDESGSINTDEWKAMVDFVKRLINLDINDISFVSLFEYGSIQTPDSELHFKQFLDFTQSTASNIDLILNALDNNIYTTFGETYTGDAIKRTLNMFNEWNTNSDPQNERRDVLFLLTDGDPNDIICPDLKDIISQSGVEIILIAIGTDLDPHSFNCLPDVDDNAFYVQQSTATHFNRIEGVLRDKTCQYEQTSNAVSIPFKYIPLLHTKQNENGSFDKNVIGLAIYIVILIISLCMLVLCLIGSIQNLKANVYMKAYGNDPEDI